MTNKPGVRIAKVSVEGLGPIKNRTFEFKTLNLIFGRNESGKTYLVEFLLRSLFRHASKWPLREGLGSGKVYLQWLDDVVVFSPDSHEKIEDMLEADSDGLPANLARLLVVQGGELNLDDDAPGGADRSVLSEVLSSRHVLNEIEGKIQTTVQEAELIDGEIIGSHRGDIKLLREQKEKLTTLDRLLGQVETRLSGARLVQLNNRLDELRAEVDAQMAAKRHRAYLLDKKRQELEAKSRQLPQGQIGELTELIRDRQRQIVNLERLYANREEASQKSVNYSWLDQAARLWKENRLEDTDQRNTWILKLGLGAIVLALFAQVAYPFIPTAANTRALQSMLSGGLIALGLVGLVYYIYSLRRSLNNIDLDAEREAIMAEFHRRFDRPMAGLTSLQVELENEREAAARRSVLDTDISEAERQAEMNRAAIELGFRTITKTVPAEEEWQSQLDAIKRSASELQAELHAVQLSLGKLKISRPEFRSEPAGVPFKGELLADLEQQVAEIKTEINSVQADLTGLKGEVTRYTGDDLGDPWQDVLAGLWSLRENVHAEIYTLTAKILGHMAISAVLKELRGEENKKIREGLSAVEIINTLNRITGRYTEIKLQDDQLVVGSESAEYRLTEISTGARDQVLFALRLGFARKLAEGNPLFLLLDDAFQHSDWERREQLVSQLLELAKEGWQVFYLTMDDHLRDLIISQGKQAFGGEFAAFEV